MIKSYSTLLFVTSHTSKILTIVVDSYLLDLLLFTLTDFKIILNLIPC